RPVPLGLRPGRSSTALPSSTISTYCLRPAPCIRSVLATTHHAPAYEIGSLSPGGDPMPKMTGSRYFAEAMRGYGVSNVFYVNSVARGALEEMGKLGINTVVCHGEK